MKRNPVNIGGGGGAVGNHGESKSVDAVSVGVDEGGEGADGKGG